VEDLKKIDLLRERMGISYQEAVELLNLTEGSVVDALVLAEARQKKAETAWEGRAQNVLAKIRELVREGNVTKVKIVTAGLIGALLLPKLTLAAAAVCLLGKCSIEVERQAPESDGLMPEAEEVR